MEFDFDKWARLARQDPAAFEALRKETLEKALEAFPSDKQRKLRGLQFCIDMERRRSKTPMGSCIRLSNMMKENLYADLYPAVGAVNGGDDPPDKPTQERKEGEVVPLRKPEGS